MSNAGAIDRWHRTRAFKLGAVAGALILTFAGAAWAFVALSNRTGTPAWIFGLFAVPVLLLCAHAATRLKLILGKPRPQRTEAEAAEGARQGRRVGMWFGIIFTAEGLIIGGSAAALASAGRPLLIPVAVVAIVGIHFVPLARVFRMRVYGVAGILLTLLAALSLLIPSEPDRVFLLAILAALVLWATAGVVLTRYAVPD